MSTQTNVEKQIEQIKAQAQTQIAGLKSGAVVSNVFAVVRSKNPDKLTEKDHDELLSAMKSYTNIREKINRAKAKKE